MSEYRITLEEIVSWSRSKEHTLKNLEIKLAKVRERREQVPAAAADFDTAHAIGRINAWVSGEIDFEVLHRSDGRNGFFHHESVSDLRGSSLENAYNDFLQKMIHPDGPEKTQVLYPE